MSNSNKLVRNRYARGNNDAFFFVNVSFCRSYVSEGNAAFVLQLSFDVISAAAYQLVSEATFFKHLDQQILEDYSLIPQFLFLNPHF